MNIDSQPIIGLHLVVEYRGPNSATFWCECCAEISGSTEDELFNHVVSQSHRIKYMKKNYPNYIEVVESVNPSNQDRVILDYSKLVEKSEGPQKVRVKRDTEMPPNVQRELQALILKNQESETFRIPDKNMICPAIHRIAIRAGNDCVSQFFRNLPENIIKTEEEADKALSAANYLTKLILQYRLEMSPKETS